MTSHNWMTYVYNGVVNSVTKIVLFTECNEHFLSVKLVCLKRFGDAVHDNNVMMSVSQETLLFAYKTQHKYQNSVYNCKIVK